MFESQTLWCEAAPVMCLACEGREERERERKRDGFTRGPSILRVTIDVCTVCLPGFTNVGYVSMKDSGGGEGGGGRKHRSWGGGCSHLGWRTRETISRM